jgi:hypothetical protein
MGHSSMPLALQRRDFDVVRATRAGLWRRIHNAGYAYANSACRLTAAR